jgi:hypothetical protein
VNTALRRCEWDDVKFYRARRPTGFAGKFCSDACQAKYVADREPTPERSYYEYEAVGQMEIEVHMPPLQRRVLAGDLTRSNIYDDREGGEEGFDAERFSWEREYRPKPKPLEWKVLGFE